MSDDYEVGYGKPPRQHRFAPGNQAASKKKRKVGKSSVLLDALDKAVNQRVRVKRGDQFVTLPVSDIYAQKLVQGMTTGSVGERIAIFKLLVQHAPHLIAQENMPFRVEYYRAEGSTVELPSPDLYDPEERS